MKNLMFTFAAVAAFGAFGGERIVNGLGGDGWSLWLDRKAEYKSAAGLIKSSWRYESEQWNKNEKWIWDFTIPEGATADVTLPGETAPKRYTAGTYHIVKHLGK